MNGKALWKREYDQARVIVWLTPVAHFLALCGQRLNQWYFSDPHVIGLRLRHIETAMEAYDYGGPEFLGRLVLLITVFLLAVTQIGTERRNGGQDFLFSLPYTRTRIFWTKWGFGVALLTGTLLVNTLLDMAIVAGSPMRNFFDPGYHAGQFAFSWLSLAAMYAIFLFVGTISGSGSAQAVFSLLAPILPFLLVFLILSAIVIHVEQTRYYFDVFRNWPEADLVLYFPLRYNYPYLHGPKPWLIMAAFFVLASLAAWWAYRLARAENNGKVVVFPVWERILSVGFVVCSALSAGLFAYLFFDAASPVAFYAGAVPGVVFGRWIIRKLTRMRLKV
mgnify:CR=1 FL=1|jgi:ABC-type transport system involved in multi-copper enzyme maturation permease subunit